MTAATHSPAVLLREVVATFADRGHFEAATSALLEAGFDRSHLSVLASHESIDVSGSARKWRDGLVALVGELKYEGPLMAAGLIALAAGPVGAVLAGLIGAGLGGVALKELLDEVAAIPNSQDFARALAAGSVILWVSVENPADEDRARKLLLAAGGANVHIFERARGRQR